MEENLGKDLIIKEAHRNALISYLDKLGRPYSELHPFMILLSNLKEAQKNNKDSKEYNKGK